MYVRKGITLSINMGMIINHDCVYAWLSKNGCKIGVNKVVNIGVKMGLQMCVHMGVTKGVKKVINMGFNIGLTIMVNMGVNMVVDLKCGST